MPDKPAQPTTSPYLRREIVDMVCFHQEALYLSRWEKNPRVAKDRAEAAIHKWSDRLAQYDASWGGAA